MGHVVRRGEPINPTYNVPSSVGSAWTLIGSPEAPIEIQGVYYSQTLSGSYLQLKDAYGVLIYYWIADGSDAMIDLLPAPLTVYGPLTYFDSVGNSNIIIFGKFA